MDENSSPKFPTRNTSLAMALLSAGVEHPEITQCYHDDFLRQHGAKDFMDARDRVIPDLQRRGILGIVTYTFKLTPELDMFVKAYNSQMEAMQKGETVTLENIDPTDAVRLAATIQHNKNAILHNLRETPPLVCIKRGDGFCMVSANASPELLEKLHIQTK